MQIFSRVPKLEPNNSDVRCCRPWKPTHLQVFHQPHFPAGLNWSSAAIVSGITMISSTDESLSSNSSCSSSELSTFSPSNHCLIHSLAFCAVMRFGLVFWDILTTATEKTKQYLRNTLEVICEMPLPPTPWPRNTCQFHRGRNDGSSFTSVVAKSV